MVRFPLRKQRKVFEGFYHEIFNEIEQKFAFDFLKISLADALKMPSPGL